MQETIEYRPSKQRKVILDVLSKVTSHPTADEIYSMARKHMPNISLGTVYRNLGTLSSMGIILKLGVPGKQKRFDAKTDPHAHISCKICGKVEDLPDEIPLDVVLPKNMLNYKISHYEMSYVGECFECQQLK